VLRWTVATVVFAAAGTSAAYGITRMDRTRRHQGSTDPAGGSSNRTGTLLRPAAGAQLSIPGAGAARPAARRAKRGTRSPVDGEPPCPWLNGS
ncbi:hypothetical protein ABT031_42800, partial [Streptomyces sp. NPDC096934]